MWGQGFVEPGCGESGTSVSKHESFMSLSEWEDHLNSSNVVKSPGLFLVSLLMPHVGSEQAGKAGKGFSLAG